MATRAQIEVALRNAHAAGDTAAATRLAAAYKAAPADGPRTVTKTVTHPSIASEVGRAAYNLPRSTVDLGVDTVKGLATAVMHPLKTATAVAQSANDALDVGAGLNAPTGPRKPLLVGQRSVARPLAVQSAKPSQTQVAAANTFKADMDKKYGTGRRALKTFADDPAAATIAAASVVAPPLRATAAGRAVEGAVAKSAAKVGQTAARVTKPVGEVITAERRANAAASSMSGEAQITLKAQQTAEIQAAKAAEAKAARLRSIAEKARARGNEAYARRADEAAKAVAPEPAIGTSRSLSEMGDTVRDPALANAEGINLRMRQMDDQLRGAMDEVAAAREAEGVGVSDMAKAKALVAKSRAVVAPDPVSRPTVGAVPADSAGGKLHKMVLDYLEPEPILLDADQIEAVKAAGGQVIERGGASYRIIKPSLKDIDELRRTLGKAATGELEGYGAINKLEARELYGQVSDIMDEYADGASKEVQANWRLGKKALEPYERMRVGKSIVGVEKGTDTAAVPASSIPDRIVSGGRDAVEQAAMVAGEGPVKDVLRSYIQNEFAGKNATTLERMVAPGGKLHDVLGTDDALEAAVRDHIDGVRNAEAAGVRATDLEGRAATNMGRASKYDDIAAKLSGTVEKSAARVKEIERELATLEIEDPKKVGTRYVKVLDDEHAAGRISDARYREGLALARRAEEAFKLKATRDKWMGEASWLAGGGTLGGIIGGLPGLAIGTVAGYAGRNLRRGVENKFGGR